MRSSVLALATTGFLLFGCGGSKQPAEDPSEEQKGAASEQAREGQPSEPEQGADTEEEEEEVVGMPTQCQPKDDVCVPPADWVTRLCQGSYPGVAIAMLAGGTPWKRAYVRARTKAVNAQAGGVSGEGFLVPGEEVVVVRSRKQPKGGMQVSGAGGYDVLRWDGTCATLSDGEVGLEPYGQLEAAKVTFRFLDDAIAGALKKNERIREAWRNRRKHCRGVTMGKVSQECERWDKELAISVVEVVRGGLELPTPDKVP